MTTNPDLARLLGLLPDGCGCASSKDLVAAGLNGHDVAPCAVHDPIGAQRHAAQEDADRLRNVVALNANPTDHPSLAGLGDFDDAA